MRGLRFIVRGRQAVHRYASLPAPGHVPPPQNADSGVHRLNGTRSDRMLPSYHLPRFLPRHWPILRLACTHMTVPPAARRAAPIVMLCAAARPARSTPARLTSFPCSSSLIPLLARQISADAKIASKLVRIWSNRFPFFAFSKSGDIHRFGSIDSQTARAS
jgi:hypothetical protein